MKRATLVVCLVLALLMSMSVGVVLAGCSPHPPEPVEPEVVIVEPGSCETACAVLAGLSCPEGAPSPKGTSCVEVCRQAGPMLNVGCVARAKTRADLPACSVRCVQ